MLYSLIVFYGNICIVEKYIVFYTTCKFVLSLRMMSNSDNLDTE